MEILKGISPIITKLFIIILFQLLSVRIYLKIFIRGFHFYEQIFFPKFHDYFYMDISFFSQVYILLI